MAVSISSSKLRGSILIFWALCFILGLSYAIKCQQKDMQCPVARNSSFCRGFINRCYSDRECQAVNQLCCTDPQDPCLNRCLKAEPKTSIRCPPPKVTYKNCKSWQTNNTCPTTSTSVVECPRGQSCCPGPDTNCLLSCQDTLKLPVCDVKYAVPQSSSLPWQITTRD